MMDITKINEYFAKMVAHRTSVSERKYNLGFIYRMYNSLLRYVEALTRINLLV